VVPTTQIAAVTQKSGRNTVPEPPQAVEEEEMDCSKMEISELPVGFWADKEPPVGFWADKEPPVGFWDDKELPMEFQDDDVSCSSNSDLEEDLRAEEDILRI
jgi:hypothetical protein